MWKTVILCVSLFASAALGLVAVGRFVEAAALPAAAAIGLCLIGIVLILVAPGRGEASDALQPLAAPSVRRTLSQTAPRLSAFEDGRNSATPLSAAPGP
jgi:hypothetical protein